MKHARILYQALENEAYLDRKLAVLVYSENTRALRAHFKPIKTAALHVRLGSLVDILLYCTSVLSLTALLLGPIFCLALYATKNVCSFVIKNPVTSPNLLIVPTSDDGERLLRLNLQAKHTEMQKLDIRSLPLHPFFNFMDYLIISLNLLSLLFLIIKRPSKFFELGLHAYDALILFSIMQAVKRLKLPVATDDHYQRWSFVLSHCATHMTTVQHGFIDPKLEFPHRSGSIDVLYAFDQKSVDELKLYYPIIKYHLNVRVRQLTLIEKRPCLLLASSAPHISIEIAFLQQIKMLSPDTLTLIKLHPIHMYDHRKSYLIDLCSTVVSNETYPLCTVFVSYNSFLKYDYAQNDIPTIDLADFKEPAAAAINVLEHLKQAITS